MPDLGDAINAAIADLYLRSETPPTLAGRAITPVSQLLGAFSLTCRELRGLSSRKATEALLQRGAIADAPTNTTTVPLAGYLVTDGENGAIFVEEADRLTRRRFSVAHELGHFVLHFRPLYLAHGCTLDDLLIASDDFPDRDGDEATPADLPDGNLSLPTGAGAALPSHRQMEFEANQFAAALLMPVAALGLLVEQYRAAHRRPDNDEMVWRLATDMLVSRAAMWWRLRELGLLVARPAES